MRFAAGCGPRMIFGTFLATIVAKIYTGRMKSDEESSFCPLETGAIIHTLVYMTQPTAWRPKS